MKNRSLLSIIAIFAIFTALCGMAYQSFTTLNRQQLREILVQLGYTVKDLNKEKDKEKYEITLTEGGLDIPVAAEISPSGNFIWLTVFLGEPKIEGDKGLNLLKETYKVQPCQFYVTSSNKLMCGVPIDNRAVDNALLKKRIELIVGKVADSQTVWK
jgi:hypothetical protein